MFIYTRQKLEKDPAFANALFMYNAKLNLKKLKSSVGETGMRIRTVHSFCNGKCIFERRGSLDLHI